MIIKKALRLESDGYSHQLMTSVKQKVREEVVGGLNIDLEKQAEISPPFVMKNVKVSEKKSQSFQRFVSLWKEIGPVVLEEWCFLRRLVEARCVKPPSLA